MWNLEGDWPVRYYQIPYFNALSLGIYLIVLLIIYPVVNHKDYYNFPKHLGAKFINTRTSIWSDWDSKKQIFQITNLSILVLNWGLKSNGQIREGSTSESLNELSRI